MKTRVTFRLPPDLARQLRDLPNQTRFVELALRDALGVTCPACGGTGRVGRFGPTVSNFRAAGLKPLDRDAALQLKDLVRLGRELAATALRLEAAASGYEFVLERDDAAVLRGEIVDGRTVIRPN